MTVVLVLIGLAGAVATRQVAKAKGYDVLTWSLAGLLVWPVALVLLAVKPNLKQTRECPDCRARVPYNAPVCRHCGRDERTACA